MYIVIQQRNSMLKDTKDGKLEESTFTHNPKFNSSQLSYVSKDISTSNLSEPSQLHQKHKATKMQT